jgi:cell division protein FtsZ
MSISNGFNNPAAVNVTDEESHGGARIKVIGVGGGGTNAVNRMIQAGVGGIEYIVANTDTQALRESQANIRIQLGRGITRGLGAGANPDVGRTAALEAAEAVIECLEGADMVFVTAGLGGGTGSGAAPVIASLASELGALTVAVVTQPFEFEGRRRMKQADRGWSDLKATADTVITIPNQKLLQTVHRRLPLTEAFREADDVLKQAIQGISDLVNIPGLINLDFADVKAVMQEMGMALMATGEAEGNGRSLNATLKAIHSPLLDETSLKGALGVLINVTGGTDLTLHEVSEASMVICEEADPNANIIFGAVIDPAMEGRVRITLIATGFNHSSRQSGVNNRNTASKSSAQSSAQQSLLANETEVARTDDLDNPDVPAYLRAALASDNGRKT